MLATLGREPQECIACELAMLLQLEAAVQWVQPKIDDQCAGTLVPRHYEQCGY